MTKGTKERTFRSNKETDEGKRCAALHKNFLTKKAPYKRLGADSEEKHEPVSDIDTVAVDSLKVLDPKRPIREADIGSGRLVLALSRSARSVDQCLLTEREGGLNRSTQHLPLEGKDRLLADKSEISWWCEGGRANPVMGIAGCGEIR